MPSVSVAISGNNQDKFSDVNYNDGSYVSAVNNNYYAVGSRAGIPVGSYYNSMGTQRLLLGGLRFLAINVPNAATITSATLTTNRIDAANPLANVILTVNDIDDGGNFNNSDRMRTAPSTGISPVDEDSGVRAHDVTALVQAIVNRAGWLSGNDMRFIFKPIGGGSYTTAMWVFEAFEDAGSNPAVLDITYAGAGGYKPQIIMVD